MAAHRDYYPAYDFWIDDLQPEFQLFINPLTDNLSRKIKLVDLLTFVQENLEFPLNNLFVDGVTITGTGTEADPFVASGAGDNIYTIDGTLTGNRTLVGSGTHSLTFDGLTEFNIEADYIELTTPLTLNTALTEILGRNTLNGEVQYLTPDDIYSNEDAQDTIGNILVDTNTINFTYNDSTPSIIADIKYQMSITSDINGLKFVNDVLAPATGLTKTTRFYYGTDFSGTKGYHKNFLQYDGTTIWSPYVNGGDYEANGKLNFAASGGIILGNNVLGGATSPGAGVLNTIIFGHNQCFYTTNSGYSNIIGYDNFNCPGSNPLWHNTVMGYANVDVTSTGGGNMTYNSLFGTLNLRGTSIGTSSQNSAFGTENLLNMSGGSNYGFGYFALQGVSGSTGTHNIGIGKENTGDLRAAFYNIIIGSSSANSLRDGDNNILLGNFLGGVNLIDQNNCILIGNSAVAAAVDDYQLLIGPVTSSGQGTWLATEYQTELGLAYNLAYDNTTGQITHYENGGKYTPSFSGNGTNSLIGAFFIRNGNIVHATVHFQSNQFVSVGGNANVQISLPTNTTLTNPQDVIGICKMERTNESSLCANIEVAYDGVNEACNVRFGLVAAGWTGSEHITVTFMYEVV
jgi:hypothetical protein